MARGRKEARTAGARLRFPVRFRVAAQEAATAEVLSGARTATNQGQVTYGAAIRPELGG